MIFNKANCDCVVQSFLNDGIHWVDNIDKILGSYIQKYEMIDNDVFKNDFRNDTRMIFKVFLDTFGSELSKTEFITCMDVTDIDDQQEYDKYLTVVKNIQYVLNHIDTVDIHNPDKDFELNCAYVFSYFNKKNHDMNELTDTMKNATHVLDTLKATIEDMAATISQIDNNVK
tara:strand:- start:1023 stop:1538 length:516 start_codon:yes stop_codon:yes gene_type:complete